MTQIPIEGVIGWDATAADLRRALAEIDGDSVELLINSPGGSVYEGFAMHNAIRDFRRAGGEVTARVVGLAASMATYIPLAADSITVEDNAVWMIHNPSLIALGDRRAMKKALAILEGAEKVILSAYAAKTGKAREEIAAAMDEETYYYGEDIVAAGFANAVVASESDDDEDEEEAVALARMQFEDMLDRLRKEPEGQQIEQLAALLQENKPVVDRAVPAHKAAIKREGAMDIKALKTEHPEVFAQIVGVGVEQERARVSTLRAYKEADPANSRLAEVVDAAIADGKTADEVMAKLQVAIRDGGKLDGENPPAVGSADGGKFDGLTDEDREAARLLGWTLDEYVRNKGGN